MRVVWSAVIALAVAGAAYANDDDEAKTPARTYTQAEVEALVDLATRVAKLEEAQQDAELEKLKAAAAKEKQDESKGLPDRVSALEKKMGSAGQTYDASKMLTFSTPDGNFTAKIGGRLYTVYRHIFDDGQNGTNGKDTFAIDTARFQLDGTFFKDFYYRIEGEAKSGESGGGTATNSGAAVNVPGAFRTKDVYMGWQGLGDWLSIQMGQFKQPMSQEETESSRFIDFAERSILNRLIPGHVQGVMLKGALFDKVVEWYVGFNNGPTYRDGDRGTVDSNDEKGEFLRIFVTPLKNTDMALFKSLRLGIDASDHKTDNPSSPINNISSGDLNLGNILTFAAPAGAVLEGHITRLDLNFNWNYGPASLRAEYFRQRAQLEGPATVRDGFVITGWYIQASYLLTGEEKPLENRVKPKNNFDPLAGGWGAWELAARVAVVDAHDAVHAGIAAPKSGALNPPTGSNHKTVEYTLGVNWWMTPNVRLMIDWEHLSFDQQRQLGRFNALKKGEDEVYIRWQIDF